MISRTIAATSWALHARGLSPSAWKILMILAHRVHPTRGDWDVWPHQKRLADDCDMPLSTMKRNLNELEEKGFIIRSTRFRDDGGVGGCTYTLNVKATFDLPKQATAIYDFEAEQYEDEHPEETTPPLAQNGLGVAPIDGLPPQPADGLGPQPKNGLAIEYSSLEYSSLKKEGSPFSNEKGPLSPNEAPPDLFGKHLDEPIETTLAEHVEARWRGLKAQHPGIAAVRKIDEGLKHQIELRAKQHATDGQTAIDVWNEALDAVGRSDFLTGRVPPGRGRDSPFRLSLAWLSKATNFREVIGGKYDTNRDPSLCDPDTGRRLGPTEQALAVSVARFRAGQERGFGSGNPRRDLPRLTG